MPSLVEPWMPLDMAIGSEKQNQLYFSALWLKRSVPTTSLAWITRKLELPETVHHLLSSNVHHEDDLEWQLHTHFDSLKLDLRAEEASDEDYDNNDNDMEEWDSEWKENERLGSNGHQEDIWRCEKGCIGALEALDTLPQRDDKMEWLACEIDPSATF